MQTENWKSATRYLLIVLACTLFAGYLVVSRAESPSLPPAAAFSLAEQATIGFQNGAGKARAYLFVDPECSICADALAQVSKTNVTTKIVPIAVYAPDREKDAVRSMIATANTQIFHTIGRTALPLWIALDGCDEPVIIQGALMEGDLKELAPKSDEDCPARPKRKDDRPKLGGQIALLF